MKKHSKRKPRPVLLPLGMKRLELIELPGHVGLMALGQSWMTDEHFADLVTACELGIDLAIDDETRKLCIAGRNMLLDGGSDFEEMRQVIGKIVQWVATQSNYRIHDAVTKRLKRLNEQERIS